jgi:hypothetical protein
MLDSWIKQPDLSLITHTTCRLGRHVPDFREIMDSRCGDPVFRALSGLEVNTSESDSFSDRLWKAVALTDRGSTVSDAGKLEELSRGQIKYWVHATRVHVLSSSVRETQARINLSEQELLAAGDRVMHVLHVEWLKKLIDEAVAVLALDIAHCGFWVSPILEFLPDAKLKRTFRRILKRKKIVSGGLGMMAYYAHRMRLPTDQIMQSASGADRLLFELAIAANRRVV